MFRTGTSTFDFLLLLSVMALVIIGIFFIFSSGINSQGVLISNEYLRQIIWAVLGLILMLGVAFIRYDIYRDFATIAYAVALFLVILTLFAGEVVNGARSWMGIGSLGIQPSEFMKIGLILMLAKFLEGRSQKDLSTVSGLLTPFLLVLPPMGLVLMQPDLGTAMVYLPIVFFMLFAAGARLLHLGYLMLLIVFTAIFAVLPEWEQMIYSGDIEVFIIFNDMPYFLIVTAALGLSVVISFFGLIYFKKSYFYVLLYILSAVTISFVLAWLARQVLKDYQMMRLIVFLDPYVDPQGAGWNIIQSLTAVGSGGLWGKGFLGGTQSHLQYLPQQSTDFIFSILSEEWGFFGALLITGLYAAIIVRGVIIASQAKDSFGSYIAVGVVSMVFFHFIVNVGMTIGIMPITGIPLLFLSYGGSSLWTAMISAGLIMSVSHYRYKY